MRQRPPLALCLALSRAALCCAAWKPRLHLVTFVTEWYESRFRLSLEAKAKYARHWGYDWVAFDEETLACEGFRPIRWRGDFRYCKLQALEVAWKRIVESRKAGEEQLPDRVRDVIFWHDVDTHIMRPDVPLERFLEAAGNASVVFTDNALSLNNGVFFLEVSEAGGDFLRRWRQGCSSGEWPWADNGCMYEVLLQYLGGDQYSGRCRAFREEEWDEGRPEPRTGAELMRCFNEEMARLGLGCCGAARRVDGMAFLTGVNDSFNHHPCHELDRSPAFTASERKLIPEFCFQDGMFMVHSKNGTYAESAHERVMDMLSGPHTEL